MIFLPWILLDLPGVRGRSPRGIQKGMAPASILASAVLGFFLSNGPMRHLHNLGSSNHATAMNPELQPGEHHEHRS